MTSEIQEGSNRLTEKSELSYCLGALFNPLEQIVRSPESYNQQQRSEAIARYCAEYWSLINKFHQLSIGQPGHHYAVERERFSIALNGVQNRLVGGSKLEDILPMHLQQAKDAIDAVPVPPVSAIYAAGTPYTTYCRIRELCEVDAIKSVIWIDAYIDSTIFHRYLSAIRDTASITLVTVVPSPRDKNRWSAFMDISRLFESEHPSRYKLIIAESLHDRWLVFDETRIYSLGGSSKDAGSRDYFTLTDVASSAENLSLIQTMISDGKPCIDAVEQA